MVQSLLTGILAQVGSIVIGKPEQIRLALACLLAKGHILIEDLPGMGKTTLAQALSKSLGLSYQRTQFTSDLLPADVVGVSIFNSQENSFSLHKGPIFNQVVLADEINRASPKTQSALLEAMEEHQVSIDGKTYELPAPFFVIATQNPLFHAGTYPLPESQLDRFMMRISLGFPDKNAEKLILRGEDNKTKLSHLEAKITLEQLMELQYQATQVHVSDNLLDYIIALCQVSRAAHNQMNPLSPRAGKALIAAAKAWALMESRDFVIPEDVQAVFAPVCQHRLELTAADFNSNAKSLAEQIIDQVDVISPA